MTGARSNEECERGTDPAPGNIAMMSAILGLAGRGIEERGSVDERAPALISIVGDASMKQGYPSRWWALKDQGEI